MAPTIQLTPLLSNRDAFSPPVTAPAIEDDLDPADFSHDSREVLVQAPVTALDHDQKLDAGKREGGKLRQKLGQVPLAETVGFARVVQRLALLEVGGPPVGPAPRADRPHRGGLPAGVAGSMSSRPSLPGEETRDETG